MEKPACHSVATAEPQDAVAAPEVEESAHQVAAGRTNQHSSVKTQRELRRRSGLQGQASTSMKGTFALLMPCPLVRLVH